MRRDAWVAKLLRHAVTQVPFYRELAADAGFSADDLKGRADLVRFPIMDKASVREQGERLIADNWQGRVLKQATGGSSGETLTFWSDLERESSQLAAKLRAREWWDIRVGDREMAIWGSPIELSAKARVAKDRLLNFFMVSAFSMSDANMAGFEATIRESAPDYIYGYGNALDRYAAFLEQQGKSLADLELKGVISTAELIYPDQRARIERAFGAPVIDEYGCRDGGLIAYECPKGSRHIQADTVEVEIVDAAGQLLPLEEAGEIAVTNLWSFGMPLVRYKPGDRGSLVSEDCACGRLLPRLASLEGRVDDMVVTPEGNRVHGQGIAHLVRGLAGVERFLAKQEELETVEILVVTRPGASVDGLVETVERKTRELLDSAMVIDVRIVDEIPPLPSGKLRSVWSKVDAGGATAR